MFKRFIPWWLGFLFGILAKVRNSSPGGIYNVTELFVRKCYNVSNMQFNRKLICCLLKLVCYLLSITFRNKNNLVYSVRENCAVFYETYNA